MAYQVVFGELKEGKSIIRKIENLPTQSDKPTKDVTIVGMSIHPILLEILPNRIIQTAASYQVRRPSTLPKRDLIAQATHTKTFPTTRARISKVLNSLKSPLISRNTATKPSNPATLVLL